MAILNFAADVDERGNHSITLAGYEVTYRASGCGIHLDKPGFTVRGINPSFQQVKRAIFEARQKWWADGGNGDEGDRMAAAVMEVLDRQLDAAAPEAGR